MGCFGSKDKLSKEDMDFLKSHTRYDEATIKEWYKGFKVSTMPSMRYLFLFFMISLATGRLTGFIYRWFAFIADTCPLRRWRRDQSWISFVWPGFVHFRAYWITACDTSLAGSAVSLAGIVLRWTDLEWNFPAGKMVRYSWINLHTLKWSYVQPIFALWKGHTLSKKYICYSINQEKIFFSFPIENNTSLIVDFEIAIEPL